MTHSTPGSSWQEILRWTQMSTPINKGTFSSATRKIPQIASPLVIGALGVGALGVGIAMQAMRPSKRSGRSSRFRALLLSSVDEALRARLEELEPSIPLEVSVEVGEGFGKPALVAFDIFLPKGGGVSPAILSELLDVGTKAVWDNPELAPVAIRGRIITSFDAPAREDAGGLCAGRACSDEAGAEPELPDSEGAAEEEPDLADSASAAGPTSAGSEEEVTREGGKAGVLVLADMTVLGFLDETARPEDLFARYGSPASDPRWRP
ncbi:hypothetical protein JFX23_04990 [Schaalia cardiffensis]|uniref:hypothetical protein n=1 Tax=Schaalia cardiffensis TaxID=181487 RepID=UPI0018E6E12D|nr:hypothetical protein [Schaalia cardiffensis]MBJ2329125.1 hypothetical protein [Schaalia cardiffensis]